MIITAKEAQLDERTEAHATLLVHRPEPDGGGLCRGCYELACHFARWPCPQARSAQAVLDSSDVGEVVVKPDLSHRLAASGATSMNVYRAMLADPQRAWTVAGLASEVPTVGVNSLRTTLHLLLGERLVDIVNAASGPNVLTLRLNEEGTQVLESVVLSIAREADVDDSCSAGERTA